MYGCMISYVYHMYMSMVIYVIIWLYEYMNVCVILCKIISVVIMALRVYSVRVWLYSVYDMMISD